MAVKVILGGSGGIGLAMVKALLDDTSPIGSAQDQVIASYHHQCPSLTHPRLTWRRLDITKSASVTRFFESCQKIDWLINTTGLLHREYAGPEKRLDQINVEWLNESLATHLTGNVLVAQSVAAKLAMSPQAKFAVLSARVGSISDNQLGGWYSYRCSKAALNMFVKTLSIEWRRQMPKATVLALHPGTTDTALSKPFQSRVPAHQLQSAESVATQLIALIDAASPDDTGRFIDYQGRDLGW